jgi:hypothetical protein
MTAGMSHILRRPNPIMDIKASDFLFFLFFEQAHLRFISLRPLHNAPHAGRMRGERDRPVFPLPAQLA